MFKFLILFIFILVILINNIYAQQGNANGNNSSKPGVIKGQVIEKETKKPLSFATISAYNLDNDKLISGAISDNMGNFKITDIPFGDYYIMVKFIGYEKKKINHINITHQKIEADKGIIELELTTVQTEGVEVTAEKPTIEYKMDKKIVNVSKDIVTQGGSAVDALQNVPAINVDIEGNVTMRGSSNFTVFINGKPSVLEGSDALEQIPATSVDNIEIITNPSAKYDPDGVGGIINVILKKDTGNGMSGIFDISAGTGDKYSTNLLLNYQMSGFKIFAGLDYRDDRRQMTGNNKQIYYQDTITNREMLTSGGRTHGGYTLKAGMGYDFNVNNSITLESNLGAMEFRRFHNGKRHQWYNNYDLDSFSLSKSIMGRERDYFNINFDFLHKFDKPGNNLTALIYYSESNGLGTNLQDNIFTDNFWKPLNIDNLGIRTNEDGLTKDLRFKVDYILPINENSKFETGLQSRFERQDEAFKYNYFDTEQNMWLFSDTLSNSMEFARDIHSAYLTYGGKLFGFEYLAGLRGELTVRDISVEQNDSTYKVHRFDLFPTMHISKDLGNDHQVNISYTRRIERPDSWDLDPFPVYRDVDNISIGNPALEPEYINSYELGYQKYFGASFISIETYYKETTNKITRLRDTIDPKYTREINLNSDNSLGFELMLNYEPFKWLKLNASVDYYRYQLEDEMIADTIQKITNSWDSKFNATFMITQMTRLQINGFYEGPSIYPQGKRESMFGLNAAIKQDFWNRTASLTLNVRDIFGTMRREYTTSGKNFYIYDYFDMESPVFTLSFSYKINNYQSKKQQREPESGGGGDEGF